MSRARPNVAVTFAEDEPQFTDLKTDPSEAAHHVLSPLGRWLVAAIGLAVLATLPSLLSLHHARPLYLDDQAITQNAALRAWAGLKTIWTSPVAVPRFSPGGFSALLLEYQLLGRSAWDDTMVIERVRVASVAMQVLAVLSIWSLLRQLRFPGAWLGAAIFAAHPATVGSVAWASAQPMIGCVLFLAIALRCHLRFCDVPSPTAWRRISYIIGFLAATIAMSFDRSGAMFPVIAILTLWGQRRLHPRQVALLLPHAVAAIAFLGMDLAITSKVLAQDGFVGPTVLQRIQLMGGTIGSAALSFVDIVRWDFAAAPWDLAWGAASIGRFASFLAVIITIWMLWRNQSRWGRTPVAIALMAVVLVLPYSGLVNFTWMRVSSVSDSYLLLPIAIQSVGLASVLTSSIRKDRFRIGVSAIVLITLLVVSSIRAASYNDPRTLWAHSLQRDPGSVLANNQAGRLEMDAPGESRDLTSATRYFATALGRDPLNVQTHLNFADTYRAGGELDKAIAQYFQILRDHPNSLDAHLGLAALLAQQGNSASAIDHYLTAQRLNPDDPRIHNNIGLIRYQQGDAAGAIDEYQQAIQIDPRFSVARLNLATALFQSGQMSESSEQLNEVIRYDPRNFEAYFSAGVSFASLGNNADAESCFRHAIGLRPTSDMAFAHLGIVLLRKSVGLERDKAIVELNEAILCLRKSLSIRPDNALAGESLQNALEARSLGSSLRAGETFTAERFRSP